jgi:hypothetical protein
MQGRTTRRFSGTGTDRPSRRAPGSRSYYEPGGSRRGIAVRPRACAARIMPRAQEGKTPLLDSAAPVAAAPAAKFPRSKLAIPIAALLVGLVVAFVVLIAGHKHHDDDADDAAASSVPEFPTHSICQTLCPSCKTNPDPTSDPPGNQPLSCTKCASVDQKCWPGQSMTNSSDHTCDCFGKLGFCKKGELPKRVEGQSCPSCWPMDNTACACFAALSYCDAP